MIKIRKYQKNDLVACAKLTKDTFYQFLPKEERISEAAQNYISVYDTEKDIDAVRKIMEMSPIFFVAEMDNEIVGLVRGDFEFVKGKIIKEIGRVRGLYVDGKYHKKGIGKTLMKSFEKEAIGNGFK